MTRPAPNRGPDGLCGLRRCEQARTVLVCIGAQKAGTSWLHNRLSGPPDSALSWPKQLHCRDSLTPGGRIWTVGSARPATRRSTGPKALRPSTVRARRRPQPGWPPPRRGLPTGPPPRWSDRSPPRRSAPRAGELRRRAGRARQHCAMMAERDATHARSRALLDADAFRAMAALHPDVRLVFVLRDPVRQVLSGVQHLMRQVGAAGRADPARILAAVSEALDDAEGPDMLRSRCDRTLAALDAAGLEGRCKALYFETLFDQATMDALTRFPGPEPVRFDVRPGHGSPVPAGIRTDALAAAAREQWAPVCDDVRRRCGERVPQTWLQ